MEITVVLAGLAVIVAATLTGVAVTCVGCWRAAGREHKGELAEARWVNGRLEEVLRAHAPHALEQLHGELRDARRARGRHRR